MRCRDSSFAQSGWKRCIVYGLDNRRHLPLPERFPDPNPECAEHFQLNSVTFTSATMEQRLVRIAFRASRSSCIVSTTTTSIPSTTFFLNPAAWANPAPGTYATSKPYYGDYRGPRYPSEQLGFGKALTIKEGVRFSLRADFFNVFNRWAYPNLNNTGNSVQTPQYNSDGSIANGFGYFGNSISGAGGNFAPRSGEFVARIQF